jgi:hypothetical protein
VIGSKGLSLRGVNFMQSPLPSGEGEYYPAEQPGGLWKISANQDQFAALPCGKSLLSQNAAFTISQSGRAFTLNTPNSAFSGTSGGRHSPTRRHSSGEAPCMW